MRILRAAGYRRMPWKNGGGVTAEIAVFPEGAGLDAFEWRLSMATVASDGPFSLFPAVDRTLAVLDGDGLLLSVEGTPEAKLTRASPPFAFPADTPAYARLVSGPVTDLNLMTRRGKWRQRVERIGPGRPIAFDRDAALTIVLCCKGHAAIRVHGERAELGLHDAVMIDGACDRVAVDAPGSELCLVTLA